MSFSVPPTGPGRTAVPHTSAAPTPSVPTQQTSSAAAITNVATAALSAANTQLSIDPLAAALQRLNDVDSQANSAISRILTALSIDVQPLLSLPHPIAAVVAALHTAAEQAPAPLDPATIHTAAAAVQAIVDAQEAIVGQLSIVTVNTAIHLVQSATTALHAILDPLETAVTAAIIASLNTAAKNAAALGIHISTHVSPEDPLSSLRAIATALDIAAAQAPAPLDPAAIRAAAAAVQEAVIALRTVQPLVATVIAAVDTLSAAVAKLNAAVVEPLSTAVNGPITDILRDAVWLGMTVNPTGPVAALNGVAAAICAATTLDSVAMATAAAAVQAAAAAIQVITNAQPTFVTIHQAIEAVTIAARDMHTAAVGFFPDATQRINDAIRYLNGAREKVQALPEAVRQIAVDPLSSTLLHADRVLTAARTQPLTIGGAHQLICAVEAAADALNTLVNSDLSCKN